MSRKSKVKYEEPFWMCDFETNTIHSQHYQKTKELRVCLAGAMHSENRTFLVETTFLKLVEQVVQVDTNNIITLYFHNLGNFDGSYILKELDKAGYQFSDKIASDYVHTIINEQANVYMIKFSFHNKTIYVYDSLKLLTLSIAGLGKAIGLEKKENEYKFEPKEIWEYSKEDIDYLRRDCEIPIEPLKSMFRNFKVKKMTAGATSIHALRANIKAKEGKSREADELTKYFESLLFSTFDEANYNMPWCSGGLTFYNRLKTHQMIKGVYCYDANSFYPTMMVKHDMIVASTKKEVDPDEPTPEGCVGIIKVMIYSAKLKGKDDFWFLRNFKKLNQRMRGISTMGFDAYTNNLKNTIGWFFECEFEALKKWYDFNYMIYEKYIYKTCDYMKDYISEIYETRKLLKAQKNPQELTYKIVLNSTFGKLMENPIKRSMIYLPKDKEYKPNQIVFGKQLLKRKSENFDLPQQQAWICIDAKTKIIVRNPIVGGYITALARTEIMNLVYKYRDYVVYGDTDSIFLTCKIPEFENSPNELGYWKNEYPNLEDGFYFFCYGTKRYLCYHKDRDVLRLLKTGFCGIDKKKFEQFIIDNNINTAEQLIDLINQELHKLKLAKRMYDGVRYLIDIPYVIRSLVKKSE